VTLTSGGYISATQTLAASGSCTAASCTFTIPGDSLSAGVGILIAASYSGDSTYASESNTATVTVTKLTPGIAVSAASTLNSNYPLTVTVTLSSSGTGTTPTGTVKLSGGGYTSSGVTLNASGVATFIIPADTFNTTESVLLVADYSGDDNYISENGSATVAVTYVPVLMPMVMVTPASGAVDSNASYSVKVTVTGTSTSETAPSGTVTLSGGGYTSPSAVTLDANGTATLNIPANSLNPGSDTLTVSYSGDPYYYPNTGTAFVTVTESTFTLAASAASAISSPGGSATSTITVTSAAGYTGTATLSCVLTGELAGGDAYVPTCSIPSTAVAMGGTATATVSTTAATSELSYPKMPGKGRGWEGAGGGAVLAFLLFLGVPARRRSWRSMLGVLLLISALGSLAGCGGGSSGSGTPGTTPDTYTFTVTGTGTPSVTPAPSVSFTVVVN